MLATGQNQASAIVARVGPPTSHDLQARSSLLPVLNPVHCFSPTMRRKDSLHLLKANSGLSKVFHLHFVLFHFIPQASKLRLQNLKTYNSNDNKDELKKTLRENYHLKKDELKQIKNQDLMKGFIETYQFSSWVEIIKMLNARYT